MVTKVIRRPGAIAAQNLAVIMKQCLTNSDNETASLIKILTMLTVLVALGLSMFDVIKQGRPFDIQSFGIGMGALFGLVGAALGVSANAEMETVPKSPTGVNRVSSIIGARQNNENSISTYEESNTFSSGPNTEDEDYATAKVKMTVPKTPFPLFGNKNAS